MGLPTPFQPATWHEYDFNGRLPALVRHPENFKVEPDGTIFQGSLRMPTSSYVFDALHGGQPLDLSADLPKFDLKLVKPELEKRAPTDGQIIALRDLCRRVRESTDRAVFFNDSRLQSPIGIGSFGGLGVFPILCLTEPDWVAELHEIITDHYVKNIQAILPEIYPYIDIIMLSADDWGTQNNLIASPRLYQQLFLPYLRRLNDTCRGLAPDVKLFLHCYGAIFDLIDLVIEAGFDVLNPIQWTAGGHTYQEWKDKCRGRIALWGGGVDAQRTLPLGTLDEVTRQAREVASYLNQDGGWWLCVL